MRMALKWSLVLVAACIATVTAQDATQGIPDENATTMAPTTTGAGPTTMPPTTGMEAPTTDAEMPTGFESTLSAEIRSNHFYCLEANGNRADFQNSSIVAPARWGLWIQYPVLSYLDSMRKRHLLYVISRMSGEAIFDNICIAEVEHYGVSTYSESVFVKLYLRGQLDNTAATDAYNRWNTEFRRQYLATNPSSPYVQTFLGRRAINVNSTEPSDDGPRLSEKTVNDSVLAGCDVESCPEGDPTLLAVVLGTYVGPWYYGEGAERQEVTVELLRSGSITGYRALSDFASNPRPINFGLEAGDIVFAVFGSIFLTVLSAAIVIGFFVHPFFFA